MPTTGQLADRAVSLGIDPGGDELLELPAVVVEHADRRVARPSDLAGDIEQALQDRLEIEVGDEPAAGLDQAAQALLVENRLRHVERTRQAH